MACEPRLADFHEADHVFEIMFESEFTWNNLPDGTRVRIVRSAGLEPVAHEASDAVLVDRLRLLNRKLEGLVGKVAGRCRCGFACDGLEVELELGQGTVGLATKHLEPVLATQAEAKRLLSRTNMIEDRTNATWTDLLGSLRQAQLSS